MTLELIEMFGHRERAGSILGVVTQAGELSTSERLELARDAPADETAFVEEISVRGDCYRVQVCTRQGLAQGGGHSAVGTAATLARQGLVMSGEIQQHHRGVVTRVHDVRRGSAGIGLRAEPSLEPWDAPRVLRTLGLSPSSLRGSPEVITFGAAIPLVPVDVDAAQDAEPDRERILELGGIVALVGWNAPERCARLRLFAPGFDIDDDPACAPAALAIGAWLVRTGRLPGSTEESFDVLQGRAGEGLLHGTVREALGGALEVKVSGQVARREIRTRQIYQRGES